MFKPVGVWVVLVLFFCAGAIQAEDRIVMDGKTLLTLCSEYQEATLQGKLSENNVQPFMRCLHYMQGVVDSGIFYERMMSTVSGSRLICFPRKNISTDQAILLTLEYLKSHRDVLDSRAVVLVMAALREAYPCNN